MVAPSLALLVTRAGQAIFAIEANKEGVVIKPEAATHSQPVIQTRLSTPQIKQDTSPFTKHLRDLRSRSHPRK